VTSPHPARHAVTDRPACTPAAIRAVLAAQADEGTLRRYDRDLDCAFDQARQDGDLTPLLETVRRWWFEPMPGATLTASSVFTSGLVAI